MKVINQIVIFFITMLFYLFIMIGCLLYDIFTGKDKSNNFNTKYIKFIDSIN